ncbi:type I-E CRISPR-associated protein Cse2/CasB [Herbidospora sp. NEAU-GS84]|uniref:Type I-E CRISPR-associated protein Cse2/CasB n=1 Tax=Herbidospora solisilvae TaxID=2696284 RepID=A0A7C9J2R6_9ACTN|nr:type I-E CRISPR-associated protein Cse2/CasB [Herbidospora solisilvae]NAS22180.1 type I-E CRISPR-associated protein Cse2/CasB [Herbidospora solisilvae]
MTDRSELERSAAHLVNVALRTLTSEDKRPRVALRRALGRPPEHPAVRAADMVIAPALPERRDIATERAFYTVAAMIAAQPREARDETTGKTGEPVPDRPAVPVAQQETLGATLGRAVAQAKLREDTTEARLHLLCRQDVDGIHRHLPRLVSTMRGDLVSVDWARLTVDLADWGRNRDYVTKRWSQDYYRALYTTRATQNKKQKEETK